MAGMFFSALATILPGSLAADLAVSEEYEYLQAVRIAVMTRQDWQVGGEEGHQLPAVLSVTITMM